MKNSTELQNHGLKMETDMVCVGIEAFMKDMYI